MGCYDGSQDHITIYLKNHTDIPSIVDTVLHEVCHHIQNHTIKIIVSSLAINIPRKPQTN